MHSLTHPFDRQRIARAWRNHFSFDESDDTPHWLRLLLTVVFSMGIAVVFTMLGFVMYASGDGAWRHWQGWVHWYGLNLVVSLSIGLVIYALFGVLIRLLGKARIRAWSYGRRRLFFSTVPIVGVAIGWPLGVMLIGLNFFEWFGLDNPDRLVRTLLLVVLISFIFNMVFSAKARQIEAERQASEAQLRLLQGQIEPHFLFNTLANVVALIDHDAPRAKAMLESFTDYLRSSLASLRHGQSTLGSELALVQAYLCLLKTRMEDRLQFSIDNVAELRDARLPPLLLQPLVENAIHHGLEPKVEGGRVRVSARLQEAVLVIEVTDDGLGLHAPPRRKAGAGMALNNLRERLLAQYGSTASLTLTDAHPGTVATLRLPFKKAAA